MSGGVRVGVHVGVLGGGAWGTALAQVAASGGPVRLWARDPDIVADIAERHASRHLPDVALSPQVQATGNLAALADCGVVLVVVPAAATAAVLAPLTAWPMRPVVLCAKGFGVGGASLADVAAAALPGWPVALLSGPTFAAEVARGLPAAATIACRDSNLAGALATRLSGGAFRLYSSRDVVGVGVGGAVKNVLAIAAGVVAGRGLGDNARAATVTRGFAEMQRFGLALGAEASTLGGLSGLGDLVLTCGPGSRNFRFGTALAEGRPAAHGTIEGAAAAPILAAAARDRGIDLPITAAVADLVAGRATVDAVVERLLRRPLRAE